MHVTSSKAKASAWSNIESTNKEAPSVAGSPSKSVGVAATNAQQVHHKTQTTLSAPTASSSLAENKSSIISYNEYRPMNASTFPLGLLDRSYDPLSIAVSNATAMQRLSDGRPFPPFNVVSIYCTVIKGRGMRPVIVTLVDWNECVLANIPIKDSSEIGKVSSVIAEWLQFKPILVGHKLQQQLQALQLPYPTFSTRDIAQHSQFIDTSKLSELAQQRLGMSIFDDGEAVSISEKAAIASLRLYKKVHREWERSLYSQRQSQNF